MERVNCSVSGDALLQLQLKWQACETEGLGWKGIEGEMVARPVWPWLQEGSFRILHVQEVPRDVSFLCAGRFVMLMTGGGEKYLMLVIVTVPAA